MKIKIIIYFVTYMLLLSCFAVSVIACPPPDCGDCAYWNGEICYCHQPCCWDSDCTGECDVCNDSCVCEDKDSLCTGECHNGCSDGECVDDDSKCNASNCMKCENGSCVSKCTDNEFCCNGKCCPNYKCCVDGECIKDHCTPMFELEESGECGCYTFECEGSITETFRWYCAEGYYGDGDCPEGTECVQTGTIYCFTTRTRYCIGECLTSGLECELSAYEYGPKAPRCLCGCCPP